MQTTDCLVQLPLSIVIPTLGGASLVETLKTLNAGPQVPSEILVCIPDSHISKLQEFDWNNVKVLSTIIKGQVCQRLEGFKRASQPYIMQLDDDIQILSSSINELLNQLILLGEDAAVAPIYLDEATGESIHQYSTGWRAFFSNLTSTILIGAPWGLKRMGCITPAGTNYGVDINHMRSDLMEVDWVPGGCVLHHHSNLCMESFFPFHGKAYCEDLIHSTLLRSKGVRLFVVKAASCKTALAILPISRQEVKANMRARHYFNTFTGRPMLRFWIWCLITRLRRGIS